MSDYWKDNGLVKPDSWVVCAANRNRKSGRIICGARHWDTAMRSQLKEGEKPQDGWDQGFINQFCEFLTREEALEIAEKNGQRRFRCGGDGKRLYSENLY
jgi:hypothetical protein